MATAQPDTPPSNDAELEAGTASANVPSALVGVSPPPHPQIPSLEAGTASASVPSTSAGVSSPPPPQIPPQRQSRSGRDLPPSYQDATDPNAPPPSYESIYGRMQDARRTSSGPWQFIQRAFTIIIGTIVGTICCALLLGVTLIIPLSLLIIGCVHVYDCPVQPALPIWLIAGALVCVLRSSHQSLTRVRARAQGEQTGPPTAVNSVVSCLFQLIWYILGCVWVYRVQFPHFSTPTSPAYCNYTLYMTCYWLINVLHLVLIVALLCGCCVMAALQRPPPANAAPPPSTADPAHVLH